MANGTSDGFRSTRLNFLAASAWVVVVGLLIITVFFSVKDEFAKGVITTILGRFLGYFDNIMNFEFGTTRGSKEKDDIITNLTAGPVSPTVVRDAVVGALSPQGTPQKTDTVNVAAEQVNVTQSNPKKE